jgi:flagellar protein FlaG
MDTGLPIRPTGSVAQTSYVRPEAAPVREAVATQLTAARSVTATSDAAASRNDATRAALAPSQTREVILDPHSREVIFRVVDVRSGRVVRQVPDEALLRLRAYTRAMSDGKSPHEADNNTDSTA